MKMISRLSVAGISCALLSVVSASANPIFVENYSFQADIPTKSCGTNCFYSDNDVITGWTVTGGAGVIQPGTLSGNFSLFDSVSDGDTHAYSNGGMIDQTVGATVQAGVTYTLLVDMGQRNDAPAAGSVQLLIGSTAYNATGTFEQGKFTTFTVTYTGTLADAGQAITIRLNASGVEGNFDNVRLSDDGGVIDTTVPEPSSMGILGVGMLALGAIRRKLSK
jgi:hypothetical protein